MVAGCPEAVQFRGQYRWTPQIVCELLVAEGFAELLVHVIIPHGGIMVDSSRGTDLPFSLFVSGVSMHLLVYICMTV